MVSVLRSLLLTLRTLAYSRAALHLEILALRHQLEVLQRTRPHRVRLAKTDRMLRVMLARVWAGWRTALVLVKPETVIAWHRQGFRLWWTWKSRRRLGRKLMTLYGSYYEKARTHLALDKDAPIPRRVMLPGHGDIVAIPEVGGLHHRYERRAA